MPTPPERNKNDRDRNDRRPARTTSMAMYIPILLAAVIVCGIGLAIMTDKPTAKSETTTPVVEQRNPFADVPDEKPPAKNAATGSSKYNFVSQAPDGLANNDNWRAALKLAAEGEKLFEEAAQAKAAGDVATLNDKGRQAREKLTSAVEMTAVWEDELLEKYGDANLAVREIKRTRSGWIDKMRWLHKSSAL